MTDAALGWVVVHTNPTEEFLAEMELKKRGYRVFVPWTLKQWQVTIKGIKRRRMDRRAIFPRYIFVFVASGQSIARVNTTVGVKAYVRSGGRPVVIQERILDKVRLMCASDGYVVPADSNDEQLPAYEVGEVVVILEGAFAGFPAEIEDIDNNGQARVSVSMFGRASTVSLPVAHLGGAKSPKCAERPEAEPAGRKVS